jgi:hypothetical protein
MPYSQHQQMPASQGSRINGQVISANASMVELDHAIGFSGKINNSVFLHPNQKEYICLAGCSIVSGDLNDPHSQNFLTAHDDIISTVAVSNYGHLLASGKFALLFNILCRLERRQLRCSHLGL